MSALASSNKAFLVDLVLAKHNSTLRFLNYFVSRAVIYHVSTKIDRLDRDILDTWHIRISAIAIC
jgi:hypothetical protein